MDMNRSIDLGAEDGPHMPSLGMFMGVVWYLKSGVDGGILAVMSQYVSSICFFIFKFIHDFYCFDK